MKKSTSYKRGAFSLNTFRINEIVNKTLSDNLLIYVKREQRSQKPLLPEEELILAYVYII